MTTTPPPEPPYTIVFARDAAEELLAIKAFDQGRIRTAMKASLLHEPLVETKNRKPLQPIPELTAYLQQLFPEDPEIPPPWELRVGAWRVKYVVRGQEVWVIRVIRKGRKTTREALS